jgi:DNA-binding XRE family transcriptional regulator
VKPIHEILRELRAEMGMTQDEVAQAIGVNRPAYGAYEEGRAEPPFRCLLALAKLYDIPTPEIIPTFYPSHCTQPPLYDAERAKAIIDARRDLTRVKAILDHLQENPLFKNQT